MSTKEQRELWTRLRGFITEDQMRELAFNTVPALLQDVAGLERRLENEREYSEKLFEALEVAHYWMQQDCVHLEDADVFEGAVAQAEAALMMVRK